MKEKYEPYFGWCDVKDCKNEGCSGGNAWRDTGYWTVCYKHSKDYRDGLPGPKMKYSAIKREKTRDKNGHLPIPKQMKTTGKQAKEMDLKDYRKQIIIKGILEITSIPTILPTEFDKVIDKIYNKLFEK